MFTSGIRFKASLAVWFYILYWDEHTGHIYRVCWSETGGWSKKIRTRGSEDAPSIGDGAFWPICPLPPVLLHPTFHDITLSPTFYLICMKLYHLLHSALLFFSTFYFSFYSVQSLPCLAVLDWICICANICRNVEWDHLSLLSPVPFNGSVGGPCRGQEDGGPGRQIVLQNHYNFVSVSVFVIVLVFVFVFVIVFVLFHPWHWMATSFFSRNLLESVCGHVNSVAT